MPRKQVPPQSLPQLQQFSPGPQNPLPQVLHPAQLDTHWLLARLAHNESQDVLQQNESAAQTQLVQLGTEHPGSDFEAQQLP